MHIDPADDGLERSELNLPSRNLGDNPESALLKFELLNVYPEAEALIDVIEKYHGWNEVSVRDAPWGELVAHGDQSSDEAPFWTVLRSDSTRENFHVISIGLNRERGAITIRRRNSDTGWGGTKRGPDIKEKFLNDNFSALIQLYEGWFVTDRPK